MRTAMELLTYKHGVDLFFYGHVHVYEVRSQQLHITTYDRTQTIGIRSVWHGNMATVAAASALLNHLFTAFVSITKSWVNTRS